MSPADQNLPLEKIFTGGFVFLVILALLVFAVALVRLAKLARGTGRSPHLARPSEADFSANPLPPSATNQAAAPPTPSVRDQPSPR